MRSLTNLTRLLQRFTKAHEGSVLIIVALSLTTLLTASGIAYEMSKVTKAKARFTNALDQALLAAAASQSPSPQDYGLRYVQTNLASQGTAINITQFDLTHNATKTMWMLSAKATMDTNFSSLVGLGEIELKHTAKVEWDSRFKTELVAMVDVSGTMCANFSRSQLQDGSYSIDFVPDRNCTKLNMMKEALYNITEIGVGFNPNAAAAASYKVGLVPFSFKVRLPNPAAAPSLLTKPETDAGIDPMYYTNFADAELNGPPLPAVLPLTSINNQANKQALLDRINHLTTEGNGEFNRPFMKRSSLGAQVAGLMLDNRYQSVFGGERPADFTDNATKKVVVMMTDSANLGCCYTNWPENNFRNHYIYSYSPDHAALVGDAGRPGICQQMKDAGIEIYTILLDVDRRDMDARGAEIVDAFKNCASGEDHAFEIPAGDKDLLKEAYSVIGKALVRLRISE